MLSGWPGQSYCNLLVDEHGNLQGSGKVVCDWPYVGVGYVPVPFKKRAAQIVLGNHSPCEGSDLEYILILDNEKNVWGMGKYGSESERTFTEFTHISELKNIILLAAGGRAVAIDEDNRLWDMAITSQRSTGYLRSFLSAIFPITDQPYKPFIIPGIPKIRSAACGYYDVLVETFNGEIFHLTSGGLHRISTSNFPQGETRSLAVNFSSYFIVDVNGDVWESYGVYWGWKNDIEFRKIEGISDVSSISVGQHFCVALDYSGRVWTWGNRRKLWENKFFKSLSSVWPHNPTLVPSIPPIRAVSVGGWHCTGITEDGRYLEMGPSGTITEPPFLPPIKQRLIKSANFIIGE